MAAGGSRSAEERSAVETAARLSSPDRVLAAKLAPAAARDDLITIAAYLGEVARVARSATEPTLGLTRLAWWRGAIEEGYEGVRSGNLIADAVVETARRLAIPRET